MNNNVSVNTMCINLIVYLNECLSEINLPKLLINEMYCNCLQCTNILNTIYISLLSGRPNPLKNDAQDNTFKGIDIICDICENNDICKNQMKMICDSYTLYLQRNNYCTLCSRILGINNPRQLCGKTYCLDDYSDDSE